jgi:hypothetical protein
VHTVLGTFPGHPQETADAMADAGGECVINEVDVRDPEQVGALAQRPSTGGPTGQCGGSRRRARGG